MSTSHHAQLLLVRSRGRSGLSPVIAAVVLVAIAIVLVASLSGFASSLLGTYSYSPQISVQSLEIQDDGTGKIIFYNAGGRSDSVVALQVIPNSPMDLIPSEESENEGADGDIIDDGVSDSGNDNNSNPGPKCTEHSDEGNCLHDKDKGKSGSSNGHQNTPGGGTNNNGNSGSNTNNSGGGQGNGPDGNNGHKKASFGILIPPYTETEVAWSETSVGQFSTGDMITVQVYLESGNRLTYSTIVS